MNIVERVRGSIGLLLWGSTGGRPKRHKGPSGFRLLFSPVDKLRVWHQFEQDMRDIKWMCYRTHIATLMHTRAMHQGRTLTRAEAVTQSALDGVLMPEGFDFGPGFPEALAPPSWAESISRPSSDDSFRAEDRLA